MRLYTLLRVAAAAALLTTFLFNSMVVAQASGVDVFGAIARWTDSAFSFGALPEEDASGSVQTAAPAAQDSQTDRRDVPEEYHEIYTKLTGVGCSAFIFPAYIPDGFQVTETKLHSNANDENVKFVMLLLSYMSMALSILSFRPLAVEIVLFLSTKKILNPLKYIAKMI